MTSASAPARPPRRGWRRLFGAGVLAGLVAAGTLGTATPEPASAANAPVESVVCGDAGAAIVRLYRAYFDREPDPGGLAYWSDQYLGSDLENVAYWMSQQPEYINTWSGTTDVGYVEGLLYRNLLNRAPDGPGLSYWVGLLGQVGRAKQVVHWVQTPEMVSNHPVIQPASCSGAGVTFRDIPGGRAADVDYLVADLQTSSRRCSVASINANWLNLSNGQPVGIGVVGGVVLPGGVDNDDRGVIGERYRPNGPIAEYTFSWDNSHMNANLAQKGDRVLEVERDWQRFGPTNPQGYRWAASGHVMTIKGQQAISDAVINANAYTMLTRRHSFVAFRAPSTITFGSTVTMTAPELRDWLVAQGYTDIVKMDGGGSVEFNQGGRAVVAGTNRDIPVWLGVGC